MTSIEKETKYNTEDKDSRYLKSKNRDRDELRRSKKHKSKRSSHRSDSSDSSISRSRSPSTRKSYRNHKSKRSPSRSPKKSKHSRGRRHRSRSPRKHRSRRSESRNHRRDSVHRDNKTRDTRDFRGKSRRGVRFDSPPKQPREIAIDSMNFGPDIPNIQALKERFPAIKTMEPSELLQKLQLVRDHNNSRTSKVDRKLYVGNIPTGLTPQMLMDLLNVALQKIGINVQPSGNPIIGAWISPNNNFAFVEFRTPEEATAGLGLSSVAIHGQTLKVGRPHNYQQEQDTTANLLVTLFGGSGPFINPFSALGQGEGTLTTNMKIQTQSRVIVLKNMINIPDLEIDEEYNEYIEDARDECRKFGNIVSIKIPRPRDIKGKTAPELGKIFVEFETVEEAKTARRGLQGTTFDERTVEVSFYDEQKYAQNDLSDL